MGAPLQSIGRGISTKYPSNRLALNIAAVSGVAGIVVGWMAEHSWQVAGVTGVVWAASSFAAWAITRELHHDFARPASFAAMLAPIFAYLFGKPSFAIVGAVLLLARISLGSTGRRPKPVDLAVVTALGLWISRSPAGWAVALVLAVVLVRVHYRKPIKGGRWWGFLLALGSTMVLLLSDGFAVQPLDSAAPIALVVAALLGFGIAGRTHPTVNCDSGAPPPSATDQFVARLLSFVAVVAATLIAADAAIVAPVAAGLISLSIREQ